MSNTKLSEELINVEKNTNRGFEANSSLIRRRSIKSNPSTFTNGYFSPQLSLKPNNSQCDQKEKAHLISQIIELQNAINDLSRRVDNVKTENIKLKSDNKALGRYREILLKMASSTKQSASPKNPRKVMN